MKKKVIIAVIIIFVLLLISIFIPVRKGVEWVNDDEIADVGHYEECYYNIYGGNLTIFMMLLKFKP